MPSDPWSPEHSAKVFELYEFLHGKPYSVANEISEFEKTLAHFGWSSTQVDCNDTSWGTVVVARRTSES